MLSKLASFFSNGGYATWFQSLIVVLSVLVAVYAIKETDTNVVVSNAVGLAQKYFTEKPTLASANLRLRVSQFELVQEAKKQIDGYDPQRDAHFDRLFEVARPLVRKQIINTPGLKDDFNAVNDFFSAVFVCVANGVCDQRTSVKLLAREVLGFYNATCPYMQETNLKYGDDDDSRRYIAFLVGFANLKAEKSQFFCRDELARYAVVSGGANQSNR
jgi:hypothetical protein